MNMLEIVARALSPASWDEGPDASNDPVRRQCREDARIISLSDARVAIEALRDNVTKEMELAGEEAVREKVTVEHYPSGPALEMEPDLAGYTLVAMLTAALNEEKEETAS